MIDFMKIKASDLTGAGHRIEGDICVIGSGAAGISLARGLASTGLRIVLLEGSNKNLSKRSFELLTDIGTSKRLKKYLHPHRCVDPDAQQLYEGDLSKAISDLHPKFLTESRVRAYGGSTNCWGGWTHPLKQLDFARADLNKEFVWPIQRDDLNFYYNEAIRYCSLGTWDVSAYERPDYWLNHADGYGTPLPFPPDSTMEEHVIVLPHPHNDPERRLAFQLAWGAELEAAPNITLVRDANVRFINSTAGGRSVKSVLASSMHEGRAGTDLTITAERYVLAAGGIETPRLLLFSDGLGNKNDQVGRYFNVHPLSERAASVRFSARMTKESLALLNGISVDNHGLPLGVFSILVPKPEELVSLRLGNFRIRLSTNGMIEINWEQFPNSANRVSLSASRDSVFGDPLAHVDWRISAADLRTMKIGLQRTLDHLTSLGMPTEHYGTPSVTSLGDHHMGTARMSSTPAGGVVDKNCRVHGIDNLYLAGSSVFRTSGFANPTLTIVALALKLAKHLSHEVPPAKEW